MIVMYIGIAVLLWRSSIITFLVYIGLFILVAFAQSFVCVYWQCPYVGRFAPCVGGFCLPSSQLARLFKHTKRSKKTYNIAVNLAFLGFFGIIFFPTYFLYQQGLVYLLIYAGIVLVYAVSFLGFICPACATRHVCPGGQTSTKLRELIR
jgi:hypothetical protein